MYIAIFIFFLNIPFGFWRNKLEKFSFKWFLSVHLPVPIIIAVRLTMGVKLTLPLFLLFVISYFSGQFTGALIDKKFKRGNNA